MPRRSAAATRTRSPAASSEFSMLSAAFSRCSSALALERAPDARVELQQHQLQRDDPEQREGHDRDPARARGSGDRAAVPRREARSSPRARPARLGRRGGQGERRARGTGDAARPCLGTRRRGGAACAHGPPEPRRGGRRHEAASALSLRARAQTRGGRTRVAGDLGSGRHERAPREQRSLRLASAYAHRQIRRAHAAARALREEALHAAVLE